MTPTLPLTRDLVLIGGGHTHALVLRKWGMSPLPGARVTVINPGPTAPYSGMLPGFVAGHYDRDALDIDLVRLARFAGARVILGAVSGIDVENRCIQVPGRPPIGFDVASVDIGITSDMPSLPGFAEHGVPAKPLGPFAARWEAFRAGEGPASVAVIGAGVAGGELAMAMAFALRQRGRAATVTLLDSARALSVLPTAPRNRLLQALQAQGVILREHVQITEVTAEGLILASGETVPAQFVTGAAGTRPWGWLAGTGLDLHEGFITVDNRLRSSDPDIFAVGDCAHLAWDPRPKAGVYAVRQAPILFANLRAALAGEPWKTYRPQKDYLKLISMGGTSALAEKAGVPLSGPLMWRWKDRIDRAFMDQFRDLPTMAPPKPPLVRAKGWQEVRKPLCTGCGAKVGRGALGRAVAALPRLRDDVAPLPGDDAALLYTGGARQVFTTDHLRAVTEDFGLMARIAAVHALGDIWAMGAAPQAALAQVTLPRMSAALQERTLTEIMTAAGEVMAEAGAEITGGHTTMGEALVLGFALTGLCAAEPITLGGARPGDALILTKPLGTGVLFAAEMAGKARGAWIAAALESMARPQSSAAGLLSGAHAMTDVTGFGLAGHLRGICDASGVGARLEAQALPLLPGALELSEKGVSSSLYADNFALVPELPDTPLAHLLADPQTAGGLLAAVPQASAPKLLQDLKNAGYDAAIIGEITESQRIELV